MSITNVVNPGLVNVADEAYFPVLPSRQALPRNLGNLIESFDYAPPALVPVLARLPVTIDVDVASQAALPPSFSSGVATPDVEEFFPGLDDIDIDEEFAPDYLVMIASAGLQITPAQDGVFPINTPDSADLFKFNTTITSIIDADTFGPVITMPGPGQTLTTRYRITLAASLVPFGISFIGRQFGVFAQAIPTVPTNVGQTRFIEYWSVNLITCEVFQDNQSFAVNPLAVGDTLQFDTVRQGFETVSNQLGIVEDEFLSELPPLGVLAEPNVLRGRYLGNFLPGDGVVIPFVGSGEAAPPFQGTTEVETQTFGRGLPANVFV